MKKNKTAAPKPAERQVKGFNRLSQALHGALTGILSNMRLSLTFRIAMHYAFQLLRTTLAVCLFMTICFIGAQVPSVQSTMRRIAVMVPDNTGVYRSEDIQDRTVSAVWTAEDVLPENAFQRFNMTIGIAIQRLTWNPFTLTLASSIRNGTMYVTFDFTRQLNIWLSLMGGVLFCDMWRIMVFIRRRDLLNKSVLKPIRDITDMAATLSASNLSNRINIAGTKNELKDLATVINTMLDRIERSYNSQKQFVSDASHELRTPIAVIQGYVNMLDRWGKDDKSILEEGITAISQETASMKDLVESLLFLARHDKKTLLMEMEEFDPCEIVSEVHREAAMVSPDYIFQLRPLEHCRIEADKGMVKQVMRILCDNAVKYTPKGGTITLGVEAWNGGCTLICSDNGSGISSEDMPKIFERFYRSDNARKSESGGHGLGLSIARIIVVAHSGKIRVRSKPGVGTTFAITLPATQEKLRTKE